MATQKERLEAVEQEITRKNFEACVKEVWDMEVITTLKPMKVNCDSLTTIPGLYVEEDPGSYPDIWAVSVEPDADNTLDFCIKRTFMGWINKENAKAIWKAAKING